MNEGPAGMFVAVGWGPAQTTRWDTASVSREAQEPPVVRRRRRAVGPSRSGLLAEAEVSQPGLLEEPAAPELGWGEAHEGPGSGHDDDERLRREVPPHHGG